MSPRHKEPETQIRETLLAARGADTPDLTRLRARMDRVVEKSQKIRERHPGWVLETLPAARRLLPQLATLAALVVAATSLVPLAFQPAAPVETSRVESQPDLLEVVLDDGTESSRDTLLDTVLGEGDAS